MTSWADERQRKVSFSLPLFSPYQPRPVNLLIFPLFLFQFIVREADCSYNCVWCDDICKTEWIIYNLSELDKLPSVCARLRLKKILVHFTVSKVWSSTNKAVHSHDIIALDWALICLFVMFFCMSGHTRTERIKYVRSSQVQLNFPFQWRSFFAEIRFNSSKVH